MGGTLRGKKDNSNRKFKGKKGPRPDLVDFKRKEALERNEKWVKLTTKEKLDSLDDRLGKGQGAKKQRKRLENGDKKETKTTT